MASSSAPPSSSSLPPQQAGPFARPREQDSHEGAQEPTLTLNMPNPAVSYGGINPEIEENYRFVKTVSDHGLRTVSATTLRRPNLTDTRSRSYPVAAHRIAAAAEIDSYSQRLGDEVTVAMHSKVASKEPRPNWLLSLPSELIDTVLSYLIPAELAVVSCVCRALHQQAYSDFHWRRHVLENLPGNPITSPYPCKTWRDLYVAHEPHWFLTRNKIWFCDRELTGQVLIVRYDARRGCIEGYQLVAMRERDGSEPWAFNPGVHIHHFEPRIRLHLDKPIVQFDVGHNSITDHGQFLPRPRSSFEQPMLLLPSSDPRCSNFLKARRVDDGIIAHRTRSPFPYGGVWPPPMIPASHRVIGQPAGVHRTTSSLNSMATTMWQPSSREDTSDQTFRIRQWLELGPATLGVHIGEEVSTYSTLDPYLYTPTSEKPWRGIWVGDYSGHGCEFLLIHQPDEETDEPLAPLTRAEGETDQQFEARFLHERVHRGPLRAIKLTGDPNVPRGEFTFVADDLGDEGFVGVASDPPFAGARVVRSKGHIAQMGFFDDKYINSQLILLSHDRLAQHWVEFGHISFFERINIEDLLVPN